MSIEEKISKYIGVDEAVGDFKAEFTNFYKRNYSQTLDNFKKIEKSFTTGAFSKMLADFDRLESHDFSKQAKELAKEIGDLYTKLDDFFGDIIDNAK